VEVGVGWPPCPARKPRGEGGGTRFHGVFARLHPGAARFAIGPSPHRLFDLPVELGPVHPHPVQDLRRLPDRDPASLARLEMRRASSSRSACGGSACSWAVRPEWQTNRLVSRCSCNCCISWVGPKIAMCSLKSNGVAVPPMALAGAVSAP